MKYVSGRVKDLKVGISNYSEDKFSLDIVGIVTAGSYTTGSSSLHSTGADIGTLNITGVSTFQDDIFVGTGATVGFGTTAYFRDDASAVFGDDEAFRITRTDTLKNQNNSQGAPITNDDYVSIIEDRGDGPVIFKTNGGGGPGAFQFYDNNWRSILKLKSGSPESSVILYHLGEERLRTNEEGILVSGGTTTGNLNVTGIGTIGSGGSGYAELQYQGVKKLETTSGGVDVFNIIRCLGGTAPRIQFFGDVNGVDTNTRATFGLSTGANQIVHGTTTNDVALNTPRKFFIGHASTEVMAKFDPDGPVQLYHDNVKRLETTGIGATVFGQLDATTLSGTLQTAAQPNVTSLGTLSSLNVTGDVSIGGTLTYEDVTNIDSIGVITARSGINVIGHSELDNINISGVVTATNFAITPTGQVNMGGNLSQTNYPVQITTVHANEKISFYRAQHDDLSDEGAGIAFSRKDTGYELASGLFSHSNGGLGVAARENIVFLTGGGTGIQQTDEALRITSSGNVGINSTIPTCKLDVDGDIKISGISTFGDKVKISSNVNALSSPAAAGAYHLHLTNPQNDAGETVGIAFGLSTGDDIGAAITHEREGTNSFGNLRFYTKENNNPATMLERMRISKEGNIGINSTIPTCKLDVDGDIKISGVSTFTNEIVIRDDSPTITFDQTSGNLNTNQYRIREASGELVVQVSHNNGASYTNGVSIGGIGNIFIPGNDKVFFGTNDNAHIVHDNSNLKIVNTTGDIDITSGSEKLSITSSGKVGIGTDDPTAHLQVYRKTEFANNPIIQARSNNGSTNELKFEIDGDGEAYFNGKVGIGTTNPSQELTVYGNNPVISVQEASASSQVDIGTGTVQGFINIQKSDGQRTVQINSNGDTYFTGGDVGIGEQTPDSRLHVTSSDNVVATFERTGSTYGTRISFVDALTPSGSPAYVEGYNGELHLGAYGSRMMMFTTAMDGRIGMGTDTIDVMGPYFLQIYGSTNVDGLLNVTGISSLSDTVKIGTGVTALTDGNVSIGGTLELFNTTGNASNNPSEIKLSTFSIGQHNNVGTMKIMNNNATGTLIIGAGGGGYGGITFFNKNLNAKYLDANNEGSVDLYHNGAKKAETTSLGLNVTSANDAVLQVTTTGTSSTDDARIELITQESTFRIQNDRSLGTDGALTISPDYEAGIYVFKNGAVELYHNNVKKFETSSSGAIVTGILTATSFSGDGSALTGITAEGSGVAIQNDGSPVGTAQTINFSTNLTASFSGGTATITGSGGGSGISTSDINSNRITTGTLNVTGVSTFNDDVDFVGDPLGIAQTSIQFHKGDGTNTDLDALRFYDSAVASFGVGHTGGFVMRGNYNGAGPTYNSFILARGDNFFIDGGTGTSIVTRTEFGRNAIVANSDNGGSGTVELYHSSGGTATKRLETSGVGVTIYNQLDTTNFNVSGLSTFAGDMNAKDKLYFDEDTGTKYMFGSGTDLKTFIASEGDWLLTLNASGGTGGTFIVEKSSGTSLLKAKGTGEVDILGDFNVTGLTSTATLNVTGVSTFQGNLILPDGVSAKFGTDLDGEVKHTGSNLQIQETTGNIQISNYANDRDVVISSDNSSGGIATYFKADGSTGETILYYYGDEKIKTINNGVSVSGHLNAALDGNTSISLQDTGHGFPQSEIKLSNGGRDLNIVAPVDIRLFPMGGENGIVIEGNGAVSLYHDNALKLQTTVSGLDVTGNVVSSGNISGVDATFSGNVSVGGTLTYEDVTNVDSVGLITARAGVNITGGGLNVAGVSTLSGDVKLNAGASAIMRLKLQNNLTGFGDNDGASVSYSTNSHGMFFSAFESGGHMVFQTGANHLNNRSLIISNTGVVTLQRNQESMLVATPNSHVKLYYNNTERLSTSGIGITVTGEADVNGDLNVSGVSTFAGDLTLDKNNPTITLSDNNNNPDYQIGNINGALRFQDTTNNETKFIANTNGRVGINTDNPARDFHVEGTSRFNQLDVVGFSTFGGSGVKFFNHVPRIEMQGSNTAQFQLTNATSGTTLSDGMVMGFSSGSKAGFINICESGHGFVLKTGGTATTAERISISGVGTVSIRKGTTEEMITARPDGAVELYYNANKRLETTNTGSIVTGILTANSFSGDGSALTNLPGITGISTSGINVTGITSATAFANFDYLQAPFGSTVTFTVTVASKDSSHRYNGTGSGSAYLINGVQAPFLTLTPGRTYRFTNDNTGSHPLKFYLEADKTTEYTSGVSFQNSYTEITVGDETPTVLHYQCTAHGYMGNAIQTNSNVVNTNYAATLRDSLTVSGNINANGNIVGDNSTAITGISNVTGQNPNSLKLLNVGYIGNAATVFNNSFLHFNDQNVPAFGGGGNFSTLASVSGLNLIFDSNNNDNNGLVIGSGSTNTSLMTTHMVVTHVGDVGIGSTTPTSKLDVNGNVMISNGALVIESLSPTLSFNDTTGTPDYKIRKQSGHLMIMETTQTVDTEWRLSIRNGGTIDIPGDLDVHSNLDVDGHTELDNLNVSGISTFVGNAQFDGKVLVGTTTEGHSNADDLTIANSGDTGITIRSGTTNNGRIYFSDATSGTGEYVGSLDYDHSNDKFSIFTNNEARFHIDSSGRVLLGTDSVGHPNADDLTIATSGDTGITIRSGASNNGRIYFSDATSGTGQVVGSLDYDHSNNKFSIFTNNASRLQISEPGAVLSGILTATSFVGDGSGLTGIAITSTDASFAQVEWDVVNNGSSSYRFTGPGNDGAEDNPDIYLVRGQKYIFNVNASGHPFLLRVQSGGSNYTDGVTNNGAQSGQVIINVQHDAPAQLVYQCQYHGGMVGNIYIVGQHLANGANNRVVTATSAYGLTGESDLTYDGTYFSMIGSGYKQFTSSTSTNNSVQFKLQNQVKNFTITNVAGGKFEIAEASVSRFEIQNGLVTIPGNVSIGGTLTYEDVTNIDSVGIITARSNIDAQASINLANSIIHTGDTDTKIEFTDNQIDLKTGGYSRLYANNYAVYVQAGHPLGFLATTGPSPSIKSGGTNNQDLLFTTGVDNPTRIQIKSNGNIGIGTDIAPHKLSVKGTISKISSASGIQLVNIANDGSQNGTIAIMQSGGVERIKLHSSGASYFNGGNLGINSTAPTSKLDVGGDVKVSGVLTATSFSGDGSNLTGVTTTGDVQDITGIATGIGTFISTAGSLTNIDSFAYASTDYKTAEYTVHIMNGSNTQAQKVLVMQNGTTAHSQEYAVMSSSDLLVSIGASISGGNVLLNVNPQSGVSGITTYRWRREVQL